MRRWRILCVIFMLAVGIVACGSAEEIDKQETTENGEEIASKQYVDYSEGFAVPVTIRIPVFDRGYEGWDVTDNYYTDWVQREFGDKYNIKVEYVAISRTAQVNHYMQLLASGTAPDIIFHYDMPQMISYYGEESMQELDLEELAYYAPTYWGNLSDIILNFGEVNGSSYFFFAQRPEAYNCVTLIRQDWLDAVNMEMPTCLEELNQVLEAWRDAGLGNGGGRLIMDSFSYDYPFRDFAMSKEEHAIYSDLAVAPLTWEPVHQYLQNLNYQYNHGLIDREFYLNTDDAATQADFTAGNSGILELFLTRESPVMEELLENCPEARVAYMPIAAKTPKGNMPQSREYWPFGMIMGINRETSDEERIAVWMYLEWLSDPENLFFFQNGVEGQNLSQNHNKDYWCLITESAQYENEQLTYEANIKNWAPQGYEYIIENAYKDFRATAPYRVEDVLYSTVLSSVVEYKAELAEKWVELYVKCAIVPEDEFEQTYQEACEEYLNAGYREILEEKKSVIKEE